MRINVVDVTLLMDQHLRAEYLEIQAMMLPYYKRSLVNKNNFDWNRMPPQYTLGTGHAIFFYNKMLFVLERFQKVVKECQARGFATNNPELDYRIVSTEHMNSYKVTKEDILHNLERIRQRISLKPQWYKYKGQVLTEQDIDRMYDNYISQLT